VGASPPEPPAPVPAPAPLTHTPPINLTTPPPTITATIIINPTPPTAATTIYITSPSSLASPASATAVVILPPLTLVILRPLTLLIALLTAIPLTAAMMSALLTVLTAMLTPVPTIPTATVDTATSTVVARSARGASEAVAPRPRVPRHAAAVIDCVWVAAVPVPAAAAAREPEVLESQMVSPGSEESSPRRSGVPERSL